MIRPRPIRPRAIRPRALPRLVLALALAALTGCGSERMSRSGPQADPVHTGSIAPRPEMNGRWTLASPAGGLCGFNLSQAPGFAGGPVAPEGGCPGQFYMSRHWAFEHGGLVIRDHQGQVLGQLSPAGSGRFEGRAAAGFPIVLAR